MKVKPTFAWLSHIFGPFSRGERPREKRPSICGASLLRVLSLLGPLLLSSSSAWSFSVLTHEQVVDVVWKDAIEPVLLRRFPAATPEQLRKAHAYAYGGCLIQDIGYYPFAKRLFTDLVHCVRTGDFVQSLIRQSTNLNEYAFALGA